MSDKGSGKQVTYQGTNNEGNRYTSYNDGGYRYSNKGDSGQTSSTYYNTGHGHGFYESKSEPKYTFHENYNQGYRSYSSKK